MFKKSKFLDEKKLNDLKLEFLEQPSERISTNAEES